MMTTNPIRRVSVITTGEADAHHEHIYGTWKPALLWIFFGRKRVRLPINVYVIEHERGLMLFDAGADRAVDSDPGYHGDRITAFFNRHIFRWHIGPEDTLTQQLERAGYAAADVTMMVASHLHADHVGGIAEIPQADLFASGEGLEYMRGPDHPERRFIFRQHIEIPGAKWHAIPFEPTGDPEFAPFSEAWDVLGDGSMVVLPTPGHIEGSVSMLVRRVERPPLLMIGDLTYAEELLQLDHVPAIGDKDLLLASFAKVRALKEHMPDLVILPAHDPTAAEKLRAAG
ncbi:MAG: MBL fold metallo-hydrolase [Acidobacteriota bacterium]|nr:MBL fold metallo-hydrolase [Acidobacteriota bacterium]